MKVNIMKVNIMIQRPVILLLLMMMVVWVGCGEDDSVLDDLTADVESLNNQIVVLKQDLNNQIMVLKQDLNNQIMGLKLGDEDEVVADIEPVKGIVWEKDGKEMVLIPRGSFEMGDSQNEPEDWFERSRPVHTVQLDAFYMDVHEVTVGQFREFVDQSGYDYDLWNEVAKYSPGDDYPMVHPTWNDAVAYAEWAGKRLPTEAEWEYAARGGLIGKRYPWGNDVGEAREYANYLGTGGKDQWDRSTAPVGSFVANGYGLYDMAGNVSEWCADWYDSDYYSKSPLRNPQGPSSGSFRVLRGGSWYFNPINLRAAYRNGGTPTDAYRIIGFRCVSGFPAAQQ